MLTPEANTAVRLGTGEMQLSCVYFGMTDSRRVNGNESVFVFSRVGR